MLKVVDVDVAAVVEPKARTKPKAETKSEPAYRVELADVGPEEQAPGIDKKGAPPKNVGETFLLIPRSIDDVKWLYEIARRYTYVENAMWLEWRLRDPVQSADVAQRMQVYQETGKWPKLPPYLLESSTALARTLAPGLRSIVYGSAANHVRKLYSKKRAKYLSFLERIPMSKNLRIRFRELAVRIYRSERNERWFEVGFSFDMGEERRFGLKLRGATEHTWNWLAEMADTEAHPSGGALTVVKHKKKNTWQLALSRSRRSGEREQVDAIPGRRLAVYAPLEGIPFLKCTVEWDGKKSGLPWQMQIESNDLIRTRRINEEKRRLYGKVFHQSPNAARHGHGRARALRPQIDLSSRYENRVKNWIENRTSAIIQFALQARCEAVYMENLVERSPRTMCLGDFPYYQFMLRLECKCKDVNIAFKKVKASTEILEGITDRFGDGVDFEEQ